MILSPRLGKIELVVCPLSDFHPRQRPPGKGDKLRQGWTWIRLICLRYCWLASGQFRRLAGFKPGRDPF